MTTSVAAAIVIRAALKRASTMRHGSVLDSLCLAPRYNEIAILSARNDLMFDAVTGIAPPLDWHTTVEEQLNGRPAHYALVKVSGQGSGYALAASFNGLSDAVWFSLTFD